MWFDAVYRKRIASGVALLKVDTDATLFRDRSGPWNFALMDSVVPPWKHHLIVKARFNQNPIDPRDLNGMRVFYRFYCERDRFGKRRPYLWLAARSTEATYAGTRLVVLARARAFLVPDKTARADIAAYLKMKAEGRNGIGYDEFIEIDGAGQADLAPVMPADDQDSDMESGSNDGCRRRPGRI